MKCKLHYEVSTTNNWSHIHSSYHRMYDINITSKKQYFREFTRLFIHAVFPVNRLLGSEVQVN